MSLFQMIKRSSTPNSEARKRDRLMKLAATTPNTINYTSQFENGLMHIVEDTYSKMLALGELDYEIATEEAQVGIVVSYAEALNALDKNSSYQLLVLNKRIQDSALDNILLPFQGEETDIYRSEINEIISERYQGDQNSFETKRYAILSTTAPNSKQANRQLNTLIQNFDKRFNEANTGLDMNVLSGKERLSVLGSLTRPNKRFKVNYKDMALTGLTTKSFVSPNRFVFKEDYFQLDDKFCRVLYVREYPKNMEDQLIHEICKSGHELAISIHAKPYDMNQVKKDLKNMRILNKADMYKQHKDNFKAGVVGDNFVSGVSSEVEEATESLFDEMQESNQKLFSGIFTVMLTEDSLEALNAATQDVKDVALTWQVEFDSVYKMQEEALNTVLPIGMPFLDVERNYMRDMTTSNVATQIPFSNIELRSKTGHYYGQNQMSKNLITIDRKNIDEMKTPSGLILGSSGSGKSVTVKWNMIMNLLKNPEDRVLIVDPESEYLPIGRAFGAEILEISSGTTNYFNILDLVDSSKLDAEDAKLDLVKEKSLLLSSLFESVLKSFSDEEASIVDRVTRLTYQHYQGTGQSPTLVEWFDILKEQPEETAQTLSVKVEPYTIGSQNIFAHETNIDLNSKFLIFNIKNLDDRMKPFAMKVILDQIWKQVVSYQGKAKTWVYFDELQVNFDTEENAAWFVNLWKRVRKYGSIPTGITQNISTLLETMAGQQMISNTEFIILLSQKLIDLQHLKKAMDLSPALLKYVGERVPPGTGIISAGGIRVPFENPIPTDTKLFELVSTDV